MGLGAQLRLARERAGLGLSEVARNLHVTNRVIESLEYEQFDELPPPIFVRGYLRQYASLLHMSPEEVVHLYNRTFAERPAPLIRESLRQRLVDRQLGFRIWPVLTVAVVVATVLGLWLFGGQPKLSEVSGVLQEKPASNVAPGVSTTSAPPEPHVTNASQQSATLRSEEKGAQQGARPNMPPAVAGLPSGVRQDQKSTPSPLQGVQQDDVRNGLASGQALLESSARDQTQQKAGAQAAASLPAPDVAADERSVQFQFSKDCWFEVQDANGNKVLATMGRAGESKTIHAKAPMSVLLGNATGVTILVDGKKLDFSKYIQKSQLARFRIPPAS
jgi:cytoskeleton protein RodZ